MILIDGNRRSYKGNTHVHTTCSDGRATPEQVMRMYRDAGYDFLAITDHWRVSPARRYEGMLVMSGIECDFSFPDQVLHIVGIFRDEAAVENFPAKKQMNHEECLEQICRRGGIAIVAHPAWSLNTVSMLANLKHVCAAEVYNTVSGTPWNAQRADSGGVLDLLAASGRLIPQVAADDAHFYSGEETRSWTMLQADALEPDAILDAFRKGRFYASQGPEILDAELTDTELILHTSPVSMCVFYSNLPWVTGRCRTGQGMTEHIYRLQRAAGERFVRCEVTDEAGNRAWLSPVCLKP